jgi:ABC-type maltose transport system permease subunit
MAISIDTLITALTWMGFIAGGILVGFVIVVLFLIFLEWFNNWRRCDDDKPEKL